MEKLSKVFVRIKPFLSENIVTSVESTIVMESASYKKGDIFDVASGILCRMRDGGIYSR